MTDSRSGYDEQLPWLEAVDDEDGPPGVSARKMLAALAVVLIAALVVAGTFYWLGQRTAEATGAPELIRADPTPYKVRPENPGGLDLTGDSDTAYETSAGEDPDSRLNLEALPEDRAPAPEPADAAPAAPAPAPAVEPAPAPAPAPAAPSGGPGSIVQLGAYKSAGQAQRGWDALSARFSILSGTSKLIVPFSGGYRLRAGTASADEARSICQALKAGGENCFVAN